MLACGFFCCAARIFTSIWCQEWDLNPRPRVYQTIWILLCVFPYRITFYVLWPTELPWHMLRVEGFEPPTISPIFIVAVSAANCTFLFCCSTCWATPAYWRLLGVAESNRKQKNIIFSSNIAVSARRHLRINVADQTLPYCRTYTAVVVFSHRHSKRSYKINGLLLVLEVGLEPTQLFANGA